MFTQELQQIILHGKEEIYLEYKDSMKWTPKPELKDHKILTMKVIRTMISMANNPDGGVIVIGAKQEKNGEFSFKGVNQDEFDSFKEDDVGRLLKNYTSPAIQFKIIRDNLLIKNEEKSFVVIQISESDFLPVISIKGVKAQDEKEWYPENIILRENAVYIRSKTPVESREISDETEWRNLIDRAIIKRKSSILRMHPFVIDESQKDDSKNKYKNQLLRDGL